MNRILRFWYLADKKIFLTGLIFFIICFLLQIWRMQSLSASMDQGIFLQILWNGLRGHAFESTLSSQLSTNVVHSGELPSLGYYRFGQHFTPILVIWIPLVAIMNKWALPFIQVLLISLSGLLLYKLARLKLEIRISRMITYSFYLANAVIGPCLGNFTDLCQLPLCFFGLIYGLEKRIKWLVFLSGLLMPMIREDTGVLLVGIAVWLLLRSKGNSIIALFFLVYGASYVLIVTNLIMPLFSDDNSKRFMIENFGQYLEGKSQASSWQVLLSILRQPLILFRELFSPLGRTIRYFAGQGLPLVFIPFISIDSWLLMGLPLLGLLLAQGNPLAINWRYTYLVVPGLFSGAIYWWQLNKQIFALRTFRNLWKGCIILSLIFTITSNPNRTLSWAIPYSINPWVYRQPWMQLEHGNIARQGLRMIPSHSSVSASSSLVPHLASREVIIRFPYHTSYLDRSQLARSVEWIGIDLDEHRRYAHVFDKEWRDLKEVLLTLEDLEASYKPQFVRDGVIILKLNGTLDSKILDEYRNLIDETYLIRSKSGKSLR